MLGRLLIIWMVSYGAHRRPLPPSEEAYQAARAAYKSLKADPDRRKFRHHWLNVAHKFDLVFQNYPKSARAPDALYAAAELCAELSQISRAGDDLQAAVEDYRRLIQKFPRHPKSDQAALALAKIQWERQDDLQGARETVQKQLKARPNGNEALRALWAAMPKPKPARLKPAAGVPPKGSACDRTHSCAPSTGAESAAGRSHAGGNRTEPEAEADEPAGAPAEAAEAEPPSPAERDRMRDRILPAPVRRSEATLSAQLGLKIRRVVIDPGHGGHDSGAVGRSGTREKDVALRIAKRLRSILQSQGLEVVLTRNQDRFVPLEARAQTANRARGDLFISIHCNSAASRRLRGIETYTLNTSGDRYSIRLAARENSTSERGISDLQYILADLATKANTEESLRLAAQIQQKLISRLSVKYRTIENLGTKEALFYVLLGVRMPAVLVETSFLSQPEEERRLASSGYQEDVARAIAAGVHEFSAQRQRVAAKVQ